MSAIALLSCGPTQQLRRAERLISKAESKGAVWKIDTVYKETSFTITGVETDTIFVPHEGDTVIIEKERLSVKFVDLPGEKVYIEGKCLPDTVIMSVPYQVTKTIQAGKSIWNYTHWFAILFVFGLFCGAIILAIFKR